MDAIRKIVPLSILIVVCDLPWLYASSNWANGMIKKIQGGAPISVRWEGALPVYLALAYLIMQTRNTSQAFLTGLCTYAVYDFTNYATLTNYDPWFAIADSLWGGILFVIVREAGMYLNII